VQNNLINVITSVPTILSLSFIDGSFERFSLLTVVRSLLCFIFMLLEVESCGVRLSAAAGFLSTHSIVVINSTVLNDVNSETLQEIDGNKQKYTMYVRKIILSSIERGLNNNKKIIVGSSV
jgi:hypothetical protein